MDSVSEKGPFDVCDRNQLLSYVGLVRGSPSDISAPELDISLLLDSTPPIDNFETPNISFEQSESNSPGSQCTTSVGSDQASESDTDLRPDCILSDIRVKNLNTVTIGTLNINSLASKFSVL